MMDRPMNNLGFRFMSIYFRFRDYFSPPNKILEKIGIPVGSNVLDFGAGTGSYSVPARTACGTYRKSLCCRHTHLSHKGD